MRFFILSSLTFFFVASWCGAVASAEGSSPGRALEPSALYYSFEAPPEDSEASLFAGAFVVVVDGEPFAEQAFSFSSGSGGDVTVLAVTSDVVRTLESLPGDAVVEVEVRAEDRTIHRLTLGELVRANERLLLQPAAGGDRLEAVTGRSSSCDAAGCLAEFQECKRDCRFSLDPECRAECGDIYNACMDCCFDADSDGALNCDDNCRNVSNPGQEDCDGDGPGDACDPSISDFTPSTAPGVCQIEISDHFGYFRVKLWGFQDVTSGCISGTCQRQVLMRNDRCWAWDVSSPLDCCFEIYGQTYCDNWLNSVCPSNCPQ